MRFAWLRRKLGHFQAVKQGCANPVALIRIAYNLAFWIFLLPFTMTIDYGTGFILFTIVIFVRLTSNLYVNNVIQSQVEQFERFPFRT
ncbi:MAG: hypothetical protein R3E39_08730 [Anaerolineae bacterium]